MVKIVKVSRAQIAAAQLRVDSDRARGVALDPRFVRIASATRRPGSSPDSTGRKPGNVRRAQVAAARLRVDSDLERGKAPDSRFVQIAEAKPQDH